MAKSNEECLQEAKEYLASLQPLVMAVEETDKGLFSKYESAKKSDSRERGMSLAEINKEIEAVRKEQRKLAKERQKAAKKLEKIRARLLNRGIADGILKELDAVYEKIRLV